MLYQTLSGSGFLFKTMCLIVNVSLIQYRYKKKVCETICTNITPL